MSDTKISEEIAVGTRTTGDSIASGAHKAADSLAAGAHKTGLGADVAMGARLVGDKVASGAHTLFDKAASVTHYVADKATEAVHKTTDPWHFREEEPDISQRESQRRRIDESKPIVHDSTESKVAITAHSLSDKFVTTAHDLGVKAHDALESVTHHMHPHISEDERLMKLVNSGAEMDPSLPGGLRKRSFDEIRSEENFDKLE